MSRESEQSRLIDDIGPLAADDDRFLPVIADALGDSAKVIEGTAVALEQREGILAVEEIEIATPAMGERQQECVLLALAAGGEVDGVRRPVLLALFAGSDRGPDA